MGDRRGAYMVLVGIAKGTSPFERPRSRWENIKMYLGKTWDGEACIWFRTGTDGGRL
jgi:hypothetical protein